LTIVQKHGTIQTMPYADKEKQKAFQEEYYRQRKGEWRLRNNARREALKEWFRELTKHNSCEHCGEKNSSCLDYHHIDPSNKYATISKMLADMRSREKILLEMAKCIVVCSNCHRKEHAELRK